MPVVTNTIKRPDGTAYTSGWVVIELAGSNGRPLSGGYVTAGDYTIESAFTIESLTAGVWSQDLVANSLINPTGTAWRVTEQVIQHGRGEMEAPLLRRRLPVDRSLLPGLW